MYVVGTAGHVDHGKSALVRAITGIDPDRLPEEKHRGMTIDLGFASMRLPGGTPISIVDVPGHERFVKNMLAGVGGIDLAMLIVAADEGVMPQTREHLAILDLLGVSCGVIVVTKSDLVDSDWLEVVTSDVAELVAGTALDGAPVVSCSAVTGAGLDVLLATLETTLAGRGQRRDTGRPRLPIDRVFTVAGFGTVVTGTLIEGALHEGDEVEIVPAFSGGQLISRRARVRTLQNHGSDTDTAQPGTRTAVNLAGIEIGDLTRGQVVTVPGWLTPSSAVDVRLKALDDLSRPLRHNLNVSFHCFAAETPAQLRLLAQDELQPGSEGWVQLRLVNPVAVVKGDHFVIRDANGTVGGGVVLATQAPRHVRNRADVLARLEQLDRGEPSDVMLAAIAASEPTSVDRLAIDSGLGDAAAADILTALQRGGQVVILGEGAERVAYSAAGFDRLATVADHAMAAFLERNPLRFGIGREELRTRLGLSPRLFADVLEQWVGARRVVDRGSVVAPVAWTPGLSAAQQTVADGFLAELRASPFAPTATSRPSPEVLAYMAERGDVVDVGSDVIFDAEAYREMVGRVGGLLSERESITMAEVRDALGSSRRFVQALLEHLDREHITQRRGDVRTLWGR